VHGATWRGGGGGGRGGSSGLAVAVTLRAVAAVVTVAVGAEGGTVRAGAARAVALRAVGAVALARARGGGLSGLLLLRGLRFCVAVPRDHAPIGVQEEISGFLCVSG